MSFDEFAEMLQRELGGRSGLAQRQRRIEYRVIRRNNGVEYHAMMMKMEQERIVPCINLDAYCQEYEGGRPLESIAQEIEEIWSSRMEHIKEKKMDLQYESIKHRIVFRLVHYQKNREELKRVPYLPVMDLALTFHVALIQEDEELGMFLITGEHLKQWGVTREEVITLALENTPRLFPPTCRAMEEVLRLSLPGVPMHVISNASELNGASAILYPQVLSDLAEQLDSDLYLLPSSIHEFIVVPYQEEYDVSALQETVREINRVCIPDEDILSDEVYLYERKTNIIRMM